MRQLRLLTVAVVVLLLPACVTWKQVPIPEPPAPPNVLTDLSRVRLNNGQSAEFLTLVVATDSLLGVRNNLARTRMSISFDQVRAIEVRKKDAFKTLALLTAITLGVLYSGAAGVRLR
jgi:hypothetical protein